MELLFVLFIVFTLSIIAYLLYSFYNNKRIDMRVSKIVNYLKFDDKILDLGSGDGCTGSKLESFGFQVFPIDVVMKNKVHCLKPQIYDGKIIPYPSKYFDVTICAFVLHHVPIQIELLKEIRRVTKRYLLLFEDTQKLNPTTLYQGNILNHIGEVRNVATVFIAVIIGLKFWTNLDIN
jgi:2-polyprenyl-3-methyl-5-hydroxy-6-metoxy-1,4-benzoquinol methylase